MKTQSFFNFDQTEILDIQNNGNITIAQMSYNNTVCKGVITIHEAYKKNFIIIEEISESGTVNEISFENLSDYTIFILDGDILKGAKQNRVANSSVLVAAKSKIILPVSCIEKGRWGNDSFSFEPTNNVVHKSIRFENSQSLLKSRDEDKMDFKTNQYQVWESVESCLSITNESSDTESLNDLYEHNKADVIKFTKKFKLSNQANGIAIFVGTQLVSLDLFNNDTIFKDYFEKILQTAEIENRMSINLLLDRINENDVQNTLSELFEKFSTRTCKVNNGICLGEESRSKIDSKMFYGLSLEDKVIHQSILTK